MKLEAFLLIAVPLIGGLAAIGGVLAIKIARRRSGQASYDTATAVPANALSEQRARTMMRRYWYAVAVVAAALILYGVFVVQA